MTVKPTSTDLFLRGRGKDYERAGETEAMWFVRKLRGLKNDSAELSESQLGRLSEIIDEALDNGLFGEQTKKTPFIKIHRSQLLLEMAAYINSCHA